MLRSVQILYLARESVAGFHRRKLTTGVTILIMGSALLVLALFILVTLNLGALLDRAREGIDVRVFLVEGLEPAHQAELQPHLVAIPGVQSAHFITKDQALAELQVELGENADVLSLLESNPLPVSYHLQLVPASRTTEGISRVTEEVLRWPEVDDVAYSHTWVAALERWNRVFQIASLMVSLVVLIAAVFVIANTVRLTMASSARVIEIQKLVGASDVFIRTPYLVEGILEGILAGTLAMGVLAAAHALMAQRLDGLLFFSPAQIAGFVLLCVLLGLMGSAAAMRQYLRL